MKIIYTVFGEGYGHAFRSFPIIRHLKAGGHEIQIIASEKSYQFLSTKYKDVLKITSLNMLYENNSVKRFQTLILNLKKIKNLPENIKVMKFIQKNFKADVVITDFEPMGFYLAEINRIPLISIDNMHIITDSCLKIKKEDLSDALISKAIIKGIAPKLDYSFINTFFYPEVKKSKKEKTKLVPPIIRDEILETQPKTGEHILVYQTSTSYDELPLILKDIEHTFIIYNTKQTIKAPNLIYREFNNDQIFKDLAKAEGIIANGGFTLITEALYLGKPVLSIPVQHQYEQKLNATMIQKMCLGLIAEELTKDNLNSWLQMLPKYKENIKKIEFDNNILYKELDNLLANIKTKINK